MLENLPMKTMRDSIQPMVLPFSDTKAICTVIKLHDRLSEDKPLSYAILQSEEEVSELFSEMIASSERFGLFVSGYALGFEWAKIATALAFALDIIPKGIDYVVCLKRETGSPAQLVEAGVTLLMDFSDTVPFASTLPEDSFRSDIKDGSFWRTVPDDVREYLAFLTAYEKDRAIMKALDKEFCSSSHRPGFGMPEDTFAFADEVCDKWEGTDLSAIIETLSFGLLTYEQTGKGGEECLAKWARPIVRERLSCWKDAYTEEFCDFLKTVEAVLSIWRARLDESFSVMYPKPQIDQFRLSVLAEIGRSLGVDNDVKALFAGVPVEDILAS